MNHKDVAEALAKAMKQDGYDLDGSDRLLIRKTLSDGLAAQRRKESQKRAAAGSFTWQKPRNPRQR